MASPGSRPRMIRFGAFELDAANRELRKRGNVVKLQPQQFAVLLMLVERAGQVVSREEIRERVWDADTFVDFERSINFAINQIRAALKDDTESPRFIETLPKRGYRFIAVIEDVHRTDAGAPHGPIFIDRKAVTPSPRERITPPANLIEAAEVVPPPIVPAQSTVEHGAISSAPAPPTRDRIQQFCQNPTRPSTQRTEARVHPWADTNSPRSLIALFVLVVTWLR